MICITGGERTAEALRQRVADHRGPGLVHELRLDLLDAVSPGALANMPGEVDFIVTCRPRWEGGAFDGTEQERCEVLLDALSCGPAYIDLEVAAPQETRQRLLEARARTGIRTRIISSVHRFEPTAPDELARLLDQAPAEADVLKLAVAVEDAADLLPLLSLIDARQDERPLVLIGMGPAGLLSRALYRRFGSPWTYVVPDDGEAVAPGQLTVGQARDCGSPGS